MTVPINLFEDFLTNPVSYAACKRYWETMIVSITTALGQRDEWHEWIPQTYGDGVTPLEQDGNPIIDGRSKRLNRAFRVIQDEPVGDGVNIAAWVETYTESIYEGSEFPEAELFIGLSLSQESAELAKRLLTKWFTPNTSVVEMRAFVRALPEVKAG